jgi:hypothetical protein
MKKIYLMALTAGLMFASCSDFLDREPITDPSSSTYLSTPSQIENYINGLYTQLPSLAKFGMGVRGEEKNSDNILSEKYDTRLNGETTLFDGALDWENGYKYLRNVNYFFKNYRVDEKTLGENSDIQSFKGEAYFLRAYWHFFLLKKFGSIPYMDTLMDENATVDGLQIPAKPRNEVAKLILEDLNQAISLLYPRSKYSGLRINKEAAMVFAMNVALYEGTWEKYHANDDFAAETNESAYFLGEVVRIGDELFQMGITLNDNDEKTGFGSLFNSKDLSDVNEVLFWKKYSDAEGVFHALSGLLAGGVVDQDAPAGLSQELVDNFLYLNGTFINPSNADFKDFNKTFENRDNRLLQMVMHSGAKFRSPEKGAKPMLVEVYTETNKDEVNPPYLAGDGQSRNITGYHIRLGIDENYVEGNGETALPIIRYAEALLDYAEAKAELDACDASVLEKTIKPLRERAGVTYVTPMEDPNFSDFGYEISPELQEIRRERRSELSLQGFRLDDLMRWAAHKLIVNKRGKGAYLGKESVLYKSLSEEKRTIVDSRTLVNDEGWMDPLSQLLPNGYQFKPNRDYLLPIPPTELSLNKQLHQNPNWE